MEYTGATQTVRVNRAWDIAPNNTSEYIIIPNGDVPIALQGVAQNGAPGNIQLAVNASAVNEYYTGSIVYITSGVGAGQEDNNKLYRRDAGRNCISKLGD